MTRTNPTRDIALVIKDADMTLDAVVSTWDDGQVFVSVSDSDHDAHITISLADWKRLVAAVDRKIS
jgi:hypothetical protein